MAKRSGWTGFLKGMFFSSWKNKGVALFLALVVWAYAFGATLEPRAFTVPVKLRVADADRGSIAIRAISTSQGRRDVELNRNDTISVSMRVRGPRRLLRDLESLEGMLEIRRDQANYILSSIQVDQLPKGVDVIETDPVAIRVETEEVIERVVQINTAGQYVGEPHPRFSPTPRLEPVPPEVKLVGPASEVNRVEVRLSENIDISGMQEPTESRQARLVIQPGGGSVRLAEGEQATIEVTVILADATITRDLRVEVLFSVPAGKDLRVEAERYVWIKFRGTEMALDELEERIKTRSDQPFRLLFQIPSVSDFSPRSVLAHEFQWAESMAPAGIEIEGFGEEQTGYDVQLKRLDKEEQ